MDCAASSHSRRPASESATAAPAVCCKDIGRAPPRRALRERNDALCRRVQRRHALRLGAERDFGDAREPPVEIVAVEPDLARCRDHGALVGSPSTRQATPSSWRTMRASDASTAPRNQCFEDGIRRGAAARPRRPHDLAAWCIADAGDVEPRATRIDATHRHLVLGKRAGLVGTDDRRAPSVSTAGRRRISALRLTRRCTPSASEIVTTAAAPRAPPPPRARCRTRASR